MKAIKVDFLIRYEHKVRELESIMLIKLELERRGYTVAFVANYDFKNKKRYNPKVILSPAIYNDGQFKIDISQYGLKKKIANLLWEQLMGIAEEESPTGQHNVTETAQKAITFCWGENTYRRIVAAGVPSDNAKVVGQINTDLLRLPFKTILLTKEQIAEKYGLNAGARWNLFVSSFAYCELDDYQKEMVKRVYGEKYYNEFTEISVESRNAILLWFKAILEKYPNDVIIYRPHPDEMAKSQDLKNMSSQYPNFHVIADLSMKHWCNAADKVYNWYSTGIIDAVVLKKPTRILRPCFVSDEYDYRLFFTAKHIKNLEGLLNDYDSLDNHEGLDPAMVADYYYMPQRFVYLEMCDILEEMLNTDKYDIHYTKAETKKFRKLYLMAEVKRKLTFLKPLLRKLNLFKETFAKSDVIHKALTEGYEKNVASEEEFKMLESKLKPFVYGEQV